MIIQVYVCLFVSVFKFNIISINRLSVGLIVIVNEIRKEIMNDFVWFENSWNFILSTIKRNSI